MKATTPMKKIKKIGKQYERKPFEEKTHYGKLNEVMLEAWEKWKTLKDGGASAIEITKQSLIANALENQLNSLYLHYRRKGYMDVIPKREHSIARRKTYWKRKKSRTDKK